MEWFQLTRNVHWKCPSCEWSLVTLVLVVLWGNGSLPFSHTCWTYKQNFQHMHVVGDWTVLILLYHAFQIQTLFLFAYRVWRYRWHPVEIWQSQSSARDLQHGCYPNLEGRDVACGGWWHDASSRGKERGPMERARKERSPPAFCSNWKPQKRHWSGSRCFNHSQGFGEE